MHEWEGTEAGRGHQLGISNRPPAFSWEYSVTSSCQLGTSHPPPCPAKHIVLMPGFCQDHNPVVFPLPFLLTWVLPVPLSGFAGRGVHALGMQVLSWNHLPILFSGTGPACWFWLGLTFYLVAAMDCFGLVLEVVSVTQGCLARAEQGLHTTKAFSALPHQRGAQGARDVGRGQSQDS